jgi:hypothetical protein
MAKTLSLREIQRKYSEPVNAQDYTGVRGILSKLANPLCSVQLKNNVIMTHGVGNVIFKRNSIATYIDIYNRLKIADYDEPRFEKNGLLIEQESSTNIFAFSNEFNRWNKSDGFADVNPDDIIAPDKSETADRIKVDGSNNQHFITRTFKNNSVYGLENDKAYTFSMFAKKNALKFIRIRIVNRANSSITATYDLEDFTVDYDTSVNLLNAGVRPIADGWCRIFLTFMSGNDSTPVTPYVRLFLLDNNQQQTFDGDGAADILAWGAQLEQRGYMSSYIPTHASPVKRESDSLWVPFEYNFPASSFTIVSEFTFGDTSRDYPLSFETTFNNSQVNIGIYNNIATKNWWTSGRTAFISCTSISSGNYEQTSVGVIPSAELDRQQKIAMVYNAKDMTMFGCLNNTKFSIIYPIDNPPVLPDSMDGLKLNFGSNGFNGHISSIKIYNEALTTTELGVV